MGGEWWEWQEPYMDPIDVKDPTQPLTVDEAEDIANRAKRLFGRIIEVGTRPLMIEADGVHLSSCIFSPT